MPEIILPEMSLEEVHILAVDDEEMYRRVIANAMGEVGVRVTTSEGADDAVEHLRTGAFTGAVVDGLDGRWEEVVEVANEYSVRTVLFTNAYGLYLQLQYSDQPIVMKASDNELQRIAEAIII